MNFLDPQVLPNGEPYAPKRFRDIAQECYWVSKYVHTSYNDVQDMTPKERELIISFITDELEKQEKEIEKQNEKRNSG